jgi:hypothetical protein
VVVVPGGIRPQWISFIPLNILALGIGPPFIALGIRDYPVAPLYADLNPVIFFSRAEIDLGLSFS